MRDTFVFGIELYRKNRANLRVTHEHPFRKVFSISYVKKWPLFVQIAGTGGESDACEKSHCHENIQSLVEIVKGLTKTIEFPI